MENGNPADRQKIEQGADSVRLDAAGELVLHTADGDVVEHAPVL